MKFDWFRAFPYILEIINLQTELFWSAHLSSGGGFESNISQLRRSLQVSPIVDPIKPSNHAIEDSV
jgi:hypothetical protein